MKTQIAALLLVASGCMLSACHKAAEPALSSVPTEQPAAPAAAASVAGTAAPAASAPITRDSPIWFEPESVSACSKGAKGTIHWNAVTFPGVQSVQITLPGADGKEGVFAVSANVGEKETGDWMQGGMEVVMRDASNGKELARAKVPSIPCGQ